MTVKEAAEAIGCSTRQVRQLCKDGRIRADKIEMPGGFAGFYYANLNRADVKCYAKTKPRGWPRGQSYEWE
jgi:excisionase family DNA binding protein